ncbi:Fic family protein [Algoriphagus sp.]|uniref:Fic family protein n=1 Tax=Algoriphagus sp. TaxID=1872435 RepID=UPI0032757B13
MPYNWEFTHWPEFTFEQDVLSKHQLEFLLKTGELTGVLKGIASSDHTELLLETMAMEAMKTSQLEGELLSRHDVMSSVKKNLGIHEDQTLFIKDHRAKGIAKLMVNVRTTFSEKLTIDTLFDWHQMLMEGNRYINAGAWRSDSSPLQVVSGAIGQETVHFEAPSSSRVPEEMDAFIRWFNETAPAGTKAMLNPILRAGIVHLYFESIHPFEDGNGRIGRALAEKAIHQGLGYTTLISISGVLEKQKNAYYSSLSTAQKSLDITDWLRYFGEIVLIAQQDALMRIDFTIKKTRFFDRWEAQLNERQLKVIARILAEGPSGFEGGMTAKKYIASTKTSKATATRDLQALVELGIFLPQGGGRSVSYELKL